MEAVSRGKKTNYVGAAVVSALVAAVPLALIPLFAKEESVSGSVYMLGAAVALFLVIALMFVAVSILPFYVAVDGSAVHVAMAGKKTSIGWDQIDAIGIEVAPSGGQAILLLSVSLKPGKPTSERRFFYPRWSAESDSLVLCKVDDLGHGAEELIAACKARAGERWRYDVAE
ncbi:hypothetical protein AB0L00_10405 [Actinoallomurus sp. NPDC052308]|uniref:hypothetical protein n=1 Tax=Actinoallomurus sp. NPDC052308 TaxID=3155530 RepID=UPI0034175E89